MEKWNLIIDVEKCESCNNCLLACKDEFVGNEFAGYSAPQPKHGHYWINILKKERGQYPLIDVSYLPIPCFHCDNAPCVKAAGDDAVYKRKDGIVIIDPQKAKGRGEIVESCPYGAIWWNAEAKLAQKCTLCAHLLDEGWKEPRCVSVCPTGALQIIKTDDDRMQKTASQEGLEFYKSNQKIQPRVYYRNLYRYTDCFIGGSVAVTRQGMTDCLENTAVVLQDQSGAKIAEMKTDSFGDFKLDQLQENSGSYLLTISHPDYGSKEIKVDLKASVYLGVISLT